VRVVDGNSGVQFDQVSVMESPGNRSHCGQSWRTAFTHAQAMASRRDSSPAVAGGDAKLNAWSLVQRAEKIRKDADSLDQSGNPAVAERQLSAADTMLVQAESLDPRWTERSYCGAKSLADRKN